MADSALRHPPGRFEIESVLEVELQGQLNQAGATEAGDLSERRAVHRSRRSVPIRVVHDIEELATELDLVPFLDREQAADIHVPLDGARIVEHECQPPVPDQGTVQDRVPWRVLQYH